MPLLTPDRPPTRLWPATLPLDWSGVGSERLPSQFALWPNHPNPFRTQTTVSFDLPQAAMVKLTVLDPAGRVVAVLVEEPLAAGHHHIVWRGTGTGGSPLASGIYFLRGSTPYGSSTAKIIWVK